MHRAKRSRQHSSPSSEDDDSLPQCSTSKGHFCPICKGPISNGLAAWKQHWKEKHEKTKKSKQAKFKCPYCDRHFSVRRTLQNHMNKDHQTSSSGQSSSGNESETEATNRLTLSKNPYIQGECEEDGAQSPELSMSPLHHSLEGELSDEAEKVSSPKQTPAGPAFAVVPGPKLATIVQSLTDPSIDPLSDIPQNFSQQRHQFTKEHQTEHNAAASNEEQMKQPESEVRSTVETPVNYDSVEGNLTVSPTNTREAQSDVTVMETELQNTTRGEGCPRVGGATGTTSANFEPKEGAEEEEETQSEQSSDDNEESEEAQDLPEKLHPKPNETGQKRNLIGLVSFVKLSQIMSFFACLATFFHCLRQGKPLCYVQDYKKQTKLLLNTAEKRFGARLYKKKKINIQLMSSIGGLFNVSIQIYTEDKHQLTEEKLHNQLPTIRLLLTEKGHFCLIKEMRIFRSLIECQDCATTFYNNSGLRRHLTTNACSYRRFFEAFPDADEMDYHTTDVSTYMLKHTFGGGQTLPKLTFPERLEKFGIHVTEDLEVNEFLAISDIESYLYQGTHKEEEGEDLLGTAVMKGGSIMFHDSHKPACVSAISNIGEDYSTSKCFTDLNGSTDFLEVYTKYLKELSDVAYQKSLERHKDLLEEINLAREDFERKKKPALVHQINKLEGELYKIMRQLPVLWYNMTYDMSCLIRQGGFAWILTKLEGRPPKALKNINGWILLSTPSLKFLDVCNYTSGKCSLTEFLRSYEVPDQAGKLFFAYSELREPKDMWKQLPIPYTSFWSDLKQENVLETPHRKYQDLLDKGFDKDKALKHLGQNVIPKTGPEEYQSLLELWKDKEMKYLWEYLSVYCNMDIVGLLVAVQKMKQSFRNLDNIDMLNFCTLPSLSYNFAIKHIANWETNEEGMKFVVKLDEESFRIIEEGIKGGSSTILKRLSIVDYTKIRAHQIPPEKQETVKNITYYDFDMLYGSSAFSPMPVLGNFTVRKRAKNFAMETVNGRGMLALSWLQWVSRVVEQKPMRTILHANSEMTLMLKTHGRARLDGWINIEKNSKNQLMGYSYEFHGSAVHSSPRMMTKHEFENGKNVFNGKPHKQVYEQTLAQDKLITEHELVLKHTVMWEEDWKELIRTDPQIRYFVQNNLGSMAPDPIKTTMTWQELLELICQEKVHGVVRCSLHVPDHLLSKFSIYPPLWLHQTLDREQCSETERKYAEKHDLLRTPTKTLCHEMQATDTVITTDFLKFYVEDLELECSDISVIVQFRGAGRPLLDWAQKCIAQRESARVNNEPIKGKVAKAMLNTFFGTSILNIERRRNVSFVPEERISWYTNRPAFDAMFVAGPPQDPDLLYEVEMRKLNVKQDSSKQIGMWILQVSKKHLLDFVYNKAFKYLKDECWKLTELTQIRCS